MNNSAFNLLPWRERLRSQTLRRWRWGLASRYSRKALKRKTA